LEDAHHIYFNALSHGNRINGSFGTDRCCGAVDTEDNQFLHPINYETYWCCTMRGGEGFARAIEYSFFIDKDTVYIPYFHNCLANIKFSDGEIKLEEKTDYPYFGNVSFEVMEANAARAKTIKIFAPSWTQKEKIAVKLNGKNMKTLYEKDFLVIEAAFKTGDKIEFDLGLTSNIEDTAFKNSIKGFHKYTFGPLVLGVKSKVEINTLEGNKFENYAESKYKSSQIIAIKNNAELERLNRNEFKVKGTDIILTCLCDVKDMTQEDTLRQVLFAD